MRPLPIPAPLAGQAIATADAERWGLSRSQLRRKVADRPYHGVRSFDLDLSEIHNRAFSYAARMLPGQSFSHLTALVLLGVALPVDHGGAVHVSVRSPRTPPRAVGIVGHTLRRTPVTMVHGLPCAEPAAAWCQSASLLTPRELVAVGDQLVTGARSRGRRGVALSSVAELAAELREQGRIRGAAGAAWALARIRVGVDSIMESELRLTLVDLGMPEPVVDHAVATAEGVLHVDLAYPEFRVAIEYEGDAHRTDRTRFRRDITRRERLEATGWRVIRVTIDDLRDPAALAARIRRVLTQRV